jgi:F-type H+-transporting ATPase subunit b
MEGLISAFGLDWKLLLIQTINFGVLLAGLTYFLYTPVMKMIDERKRMVAEGVRSAQEADRVLSDSKQRGDSIVGDAAREAEGLVAAARSRANERGAQIVGEAEQKAHALMLEARAQAEEAKRQALQESQKEITRAAVLAAEKILRERA